MRADSRFGKILIVFVIGVLAMAPGCYGPFTLTKSLHEWNGEIGEKWVNELVFLGLIILPVYGIATIGDALIFNSIEFWTGENPLDDAGGSLVLEDGDTRIRLEREDDGRALSVAVTVDDRTVSESRIVLDEAGVARKYDASGNLVATARVSDSGTLHVIDENGAEREMSRDEIRAFLAED